MCPLIERWPIVCLLLVLFSGGRSEAKYPWEKPPGPIAGIWAASCATSKGLLVEFTVNESDAVGKVVALGAAAKYGYTVGEEIFRLSVDDFGEWVGTLRIRTVSGREYWDPIRFVASKGLLNATMTTDACYKNMRPATK